jgi:hypothetical protein
MIKAYHFMDSTDFARVPLLSSKPHFTELHHQILHQLLHLAYVFLNLIPVLLCLHHLRLDPSAQPVNMWQVILHSDKHI